VTRLTGTERGAESTRFCFVRGLVCGGEGFFRRSADTIDRRHVRDDRRQTFYMYLFGRRNNDDADTRPTDSYEMRVTGFMVAVCFYASKNGTTSTASIDFRAVSPPPPLEHIRGTRGGPG